MSTKREMEITLYERTYKARKAWLQSLKEYDASDHDSTLWFNQNSAFKVLDTLYGLIEDMQLEAKYEHYITEKYGDEVDKEEIAIA